MTETVVDTDELRVGEAVRVTETRRRGCVAEVDLGMHVARIEFPNGTEGWFLVDALEVIHSRRSW